MIGLADTAYIISECGNLLIIALLRISQFETHEYGFD